MRGSLPKSGMRLPILGFVLSLSPTTIAVGATTPLTLCIGTACAPIDRADWNDPSVPPNHVVTWVGPVRAVYPYVRGYLELATNRLHADGDPIFRNAFED